MIDMENGLLSDLTIVPKLIFWRCSSVRMLCWIESVKVSNDLYLYYFVREIVFVFLLGKGI